MLLRKRPKIQMLWPSAMGKSEAEVIKTNQRRKDQKTICRRGQVEAQVQIKSPLGYSMQAKDLLKLRLKRVSSRLWSPILWNGMVSSHLWSRIRWLAEVSSYLLPDSSAAHYTADEATCLLCCNVASSTGYKIPHISPLTSARVSMRRHHICMGRNPRCWWVVWWALLRYPRISCPHGRSWPRCHL